MNAAEIKTAILKEHTKPAKPVEKRAIFGFEGWLFKPTSYQMEGWRQMANAVNPDGSADEEKQKLAAAKLVQISFRDSENNPVFDELDLPVIAGMPDDQIHPLRLAILRINGMNTEGFEAVLKNLIAILGTDGVYDLLASINAPCPNCRKDTPNTSSGSSTSASNTGPPEGQRKAIKPSSSEKS